MAIPPASPLSAEAGSSKLTSPPTNKRAASTSLSDSETLVTKTKKTPPTATPAVKANSAAIDAHRRKRKKKKFTVTQSVSSVSRSSGTSSSGSLKGKERAIRTVDSSDESSENISDANASNELALLRMKLDQQTTLLDAHKEFLSSLAPSLTCQICLDPMHRPYTLAPCGHTACYECLLAWFRAPPQHIGQPPPQHLAYNFDAEEPTLLARDAPMLLKKEKTCPHCRAVILDAPVEAWGIKDIVSHLFAHKGGVAKDLYPSYTRPLVASEAGVGQTGVDAWKGIFKRKRVPGMLAVRNRNGGAEAMNDEDGQQDGARGFYDEEDAVYRCTECYHEIWDGICSSCGRLYPGLHADLGDEDEDVDPGHWMDAEEFGGFDEAELLDPDVVFGGPDADVDLRGLMDVFARGVGLHRDVDREHDEEGADEEGYESSFIDDDDEHVRMEEYHSAEDAGDYGSGDDEVLSNDGENHWARRMSPPRIALAGGGSAGEDAERRGAAIELTDSESDGSGPLINYQRARASRTRIDSDEDDADSDVRHAVRAPEAARARRAIIIDSDSEGEEHSDVGVGHNRRYYSRSLSDEGSLSGDGSDHSSQHGSLHGSLSGLSHDNYDNYAFSDEEEGINWSD